MPQRFHTNQIAQQIISIINDAHGKELSPSPLALNVIAQGDVSMLPGPNHISNWLPAVLVDPQMFEPSEVTLSGGMLINYRFNIMYFREFVEEEDIKQKIVDEVQKIAETLMDDELIGDPDLTNAEIDNCMVKRVSLADETEEFFRAVELNISAARIEFEVIIRTQR